MSVVVLCLGDPDRLERTAECLRRGDANVEVRTFRRATAALEAVTEAPGTVDCVVGDDRMPDHDGLELFERIETRLATPPPFVLYTGQGSEQRASEAVGAGVTDYVPKGSDRPEGLADRVATAVERGRARRRATTLDRVNTVVRTIGQRLVEAASRDEIDRAACEAFAGTEPYQFAWVGGVADGRIAPRASAGPHEPYLDRITVTADETATGRGPAGTALADDRVVVQDVADDEAFRPWREAALDRGFRSVAAVPLRYAGVTYGVLAVYADRPAAFDTTARSVLSELGELIGHAYHQVDVHRRHDRQYHELLETAPVLFAQTTDRDGTAVIDDCNELFADALGYAREELRDTPLAEVYSSDSTAALVDVGGYDRALDGEFVRERRELVTAEGETVPVVLRAAPRWDATGAVVGTNALYVATDGDAQIGRLETLRERMEFALELTDSHVFEIDPTTGEQTRYGAFERLFGVDPDAVATTEAFVETCVHPEDRPAFERAERSVADGDANADGDDPVRLQYRTHPDNGPVRWIETRLYEKRTPHEERRSVLVGLATDVTRRRERRRKLQDATARLERRNRAVESFVEEIVDDDRPFGRRVERILELGRDHLGMDVGLVSSIDDGVYTVEYASGSDGEPAVGATFDLEETYCSLVVDADGPIGFHEPGAAAVEAHPAYRGRGVEAYLGVPIRVDGALYGTVNFSSADRREEPFADAERTLVRLFARWLESELSRRRSQARAAERRERLEAQNERLDEFASVVSHDVRSPLNLAQGRLELLREDGCTSDHLDGIDHGLARIETLLADLSELARQGKQVGETTAVDLAGLVRDCWRTMPDEADGVGLELTATRTVRADRSRLRQLVENLLRNAVEHGDGVERVTVGDDADGFYVADDGTGIAPDERGRVLDEGYSTRPDGTGLGLSIVRGIAVAHGWTVTVEESATGGARIAFRGVEVVDETAGEG